MTISTQVSEMRVEPPQDPGSLEGQLHSLYAERELLAAELGTADANELIALVAELRLGAAPFDESLVMQVESLYGERDLLQQALGVSSADEVIELVRSLRENTSVPPVAVVN